MIATRPLLLSLIVLTGVTQSGAMRPAQPVAVLTTSGKQANARPRPDADVGGQQADGKKRQSHAGGVPNGQRFVQEAPKYPIERPCKYGEKQLDSDLCAQWYAAKGATDGAAYAFWGMLVGLVGTVLIIVSLYYARRGTALAAEAVDAAKGAIRIAELANGEAARANELAAEAIERSITDFNERMRPRCAVTGITLVEDWHDFIRAGSDLPLTIKVENLGGATGRHLLVQIEQLAFHDVSGRVIAANPWLLRLAPLRAGQVRSEEMLLSHTAAGNEVHGITVSGRIGSMGDPIEGADGNLTMVEEFSWRENPMNRSSADLVERAQDDHRGYSKPQAAGLPPFAPALGSAF